MKFFLLFLGALVGVSSGLKTEDSAKGEGMLSDPKLLAELLPKSFDELFDMLEKMVPGMKELQTPLEIGTTIFLPLLKVSL